MILIAHRGLVDGPNKQIENNPKIINQALAAGFDAEIDLQFVDGKLYLGHDEPTYEITIDFLNQKGLWIHAKTVEALRFLSSVMPSTNYFFHEEDPMVITSHGWIWVHPKHFENNLSDMRTIAVVPEYVIPVDQIKDLCVSGICSDYVGVIK